MRGKQTERTARLASMAAALAASILLAASTQAQDRSGIVAERIQSPLPLHTFSWEDMWPRGVHSEESFGCATRVEFGDWRFVPSEPNQEREFWARIRNHGVHHCAAIIQIADDRADLEQAHSEYGFFVRLGTARNGSGDWELWAIQQGVRPGSSYTLLAREAAGGGVIEQFRVLQHRCPPGRILQAENMDVWLTRYCSIDSREALLSLAEAMLELPPRGTIARVAPAE